MLKRKRWDSFSKGKEYIIVWWYTLSDSLSWYEMVWYLMMARTDMESTKLLRFSSSKGTEYVRQSFNLTTSMLYLLYLFLVLVLYSVERTDVERTKVLGVCNEYE